MTSLHKPDLHLHLLQVIKALTRSIRQLQQQIRRQNQMEKNFFVSAVLRRVTLAVYIEAGHCRNAAGQYLQQHAVMTDTNRSLADWATVVEDLFLATSPEELASYAFPESKEEKVASFRAKKWLGQRGASAWVLEQNYKDIAPSSTALLANFAQAAGPSVIAHMGTSERAGRDFCQKLRAKWGLRLGSLQIQDPISDEDIQAKAGESSLLGMIRSH